MSDSKKLMIVTGGLGTGGLERISANVANFYAKKGWEVTIVNLLNPREEIFVSLDPKIVVSCFRDMPDNPTKFQKLFLAKKWIRFLKETIDSHAPSHILAMTFKIGSLVCRAGGLKRARVVVREISDPRSKARSRLMNAITYHLCRKVDGVIFQTNWERECAPKKLREKGSVVPNPVTELPRATPEKRNAIVTMGRLYNYQKRHDILIKSFGIFHETHPDYTLEIFGVGPDLEEDKRMVQTLGLDGSVIFMGAKKDVHERILDSACFVLTSEYEGMSNALLEAFLIGIPCVSSDWPGVEDIITNEADGLIAPRNNIDKIAAAMSMIVDDQSMSKRFSERAVSQFHRYALASVMEQYCSIIEGRP